MKKHEVETRLRRAYAHTTPDVFAAIQTACSEPKGETIVMTKIKKVTPWKKALATAAAVVLLLGAVSGIGLYLNAHQGETTVSLDVNPALSLTVNHNERVVKVTPRNEDAKKVIGTMQLAGNDLTLAVNALIGSMLREGYLDNTANSILISVEDEDEKRGTALEKKLSDQIDGLLHTDTIDGAVISQTVSKPNQELKERAEAYGITVGKAHLIDRIIRQNSHHTFDELVGLTIHQLHLISSNDNGSKLENVSATGHASHKAYVGVEAAKLAAWYATVGDQDVASPAIKADMDYEDGKMVYEIEFVYDQLEYEYHIDALNGDVLTVEKEPTDKADTTNTTTKPTKTNGNSKAIGVDTAKAIAWKASGITDTQNPPPTEVELDREKGKVVYEVDFTYNGTEYAYEIDGASGTILTVDKETEDDDHRDTGNTSKADKTTQKTQKTTVAYIGEEAAKAAAFAHAGIPKGQAPAAQAELDREDGKAVYEIEFVYQGTEYDYIIDALSGAVLHSETEAA